LGHVDFTFQVDRVEARSGMTRATQRRKFTTRDQVMSDQHDLVEVVHELKQVLRVKG
jgi:hypothetical protein